MESKAPTWSEFVLWPFSARVRTFFNEAGIRDVAQLTEKTADDLVRHRGIGKSALNELRLALAGYGLTLSGEKLPVETSASEVETLLNERVKLKARLREIRLRLEQLTAAKDKPRLGPKVIAKWLELRDAAAVAQAMGISKGKVDSFVNASWRRRLKSGDLHEHQILERWAILRSFNRVAEEFHVPEYLVRNIVQKLTK